MTIAAITSKHTDEELAVLFPGSHLQRIRVSSPEEAIAIPAVSVILDLEFEPLGHRIGVLSRSKEALVIINAVAPTLKELGSSFIRINGWPGFLEREIHELAAADAGMIAKVDRFYGGVQKQYRIVPDIPGLVSARILATIINEAWYTWEENVSTKEDIDTAMKLGTNYPMGPFEWGDRIGLKRIGQLLRTMSLENERYAPAASLQQAIDKLKYD